MAELVRAQGGATMAKPILDDALWESIGPLLPPPKPRRRRHPGRKPIPHRAALTGILYVLRTGIPWEYLPQERACGSGMTCRRRLRDWQAAGAWEHIRRRLLNELRAADQIDWSRAVVDSASLLARRSAKHGSGLGTTRWVVERTLSWLHQFRRLCTRWERRADIHQAFLTLACILLCCDFAVRLL
jgi:transposase